MGILRRAARRLMRAAWNGCALAGIGMLVFPIFFESTKMTSCSMAPTLRGTSWENGDRVLMEKCSYWFRLPRRWEIVAIRRPDRTLVMKRVVALPGETIQILQDGTILVDGRVMEPPEVLSSVRYLPFGNVVADSAAKCGEGYYVLGDFARDSDDSRFNGPVAIDKIVGRAAWIAGPWNRFGPISGAAERGPHFKSSPIERIPPPW